MYDVSVERIAEADGREVVLGGWLQNARSSGKLLFLQLRDGTGTIQCVVAQDEVSPEAFEAAAGLKQESAFEVHGVVRADPRAPIGYELHVGDLRVVHGTDGYPITLKSHGAPFLMDHRHLWVRSSRQGAILRVRSSIGGAIREFFEGRDFVLIDAPILTSLACEGTTTLFETDYFGEPAYLSQSGQLYMEACAMALGRVYCFGPTFRAEKSTGPHHLTEFWMVEPEMAFATLDDAIELAQALIAHIVARVLDECRRELATLERDTALLERIVPPFPRITYDEATDRLEAMGTGFVRGDDFGKEDERTLSESFEAPVIITHYPRACKAFYMKPDPKRPDRALCVDVLAPESFGEIVGGGQREDDLEALEARLQGEGLPLESFGWYLDLRRYGSVPHAGFGLGLERMVAWLCGLEHVREAIPFPRTVGRLRP